MCFLMQMAAVSLRSIPPSIRNSAAGTMMHMSEHTSGLPWLDQPVTLHSSRADTCKLTPEQCAYRRGHWRYWCVFSMHVASRLTLTSD